MELAQPYPTHGGYGGFYAKIALTSIQEAEVNPRGEINSLSQKMVRIMDKAH